MDKTLEIYLIAVNTVAFVSLVGFIVLISSKISQKNSFKVMGWFFLVITIIGMYLFIPSRLFISGIINQNINLLEKAIKLSINPIEKRFFREVSNDIQNKYMSQELSEIINKVKKADLLFFEVQNFYNLKKQEYNKKLREKYDRL